LTPNQREALKQGKIDGISRNTSDGVGGTIGSIGGSASGNTGVSEGRDDNE